ncbi:MAG: leucine-rich repeat domain-containing protein [Huintestinicola sp.]
MISISNKTICKHCFAEISSEPCPECGFSEESYVPDPTTLACGSVLQDRYVIGRLIGKGGFGVTYLAYDTKLDRKVAIKEYYPYGLALRGSGDPTVSVATNESAETFKNGAEKFYEEARLVAKFNGNPAIVGVYDFFYENATVYYTMEYLQGQTLKDYVTSNGVITPEQAVFIAQEVSFALMTAHSANVLHRDVSPDNIMLCSDGKVKLIDFGAARQVVAEGSQSLSVILKPGFAPLEQYQKKGKQGPWTDIYSLGSVLYYGLTGNIPDDPMSRLEDDEEFETGLQSINEELRDIIRTAANLKKSERYKDIFEFRNALNEISIKGEPIIKVSSVPKFEIPEGATAKPFIASTATDSMSKTVPMSSAMPKTVPLKTDMPKTVPITAQPPKTSAMPKTVALTEESSRKKSSVGIIAAAAVCIVLIITVGAVIIFKGDSDIETVDSESTTASSSETTTQTETESETETAAAVTETTAETEATATTAKEEKEEAVSAAVTTEEESEPSVTTTPKREPKPEPTTTKATTTKATTPAVTTTKATTPAVTTTKATKPAVTTTKATTPAVTTTKATTPAVTTTKAATTAKANTDPKNSDSISIGGKTYKKSMTGVLDLRNMKLTDSDIENLKYMTKVTEIILSDNDLTDLSPLSKLTQLEKLTFHNNRVTDLSFAKNLINLKVFGAENNGISDIEPLKKLIKLEELWVKNNSLTDLSPLKSFRNLLYVDLTSNQIKDFRALANCKGIKVLYISNNKFYGNYNALDGIVILEDLYMEDNGFKDWEEIQKYLGKVYCDDDGATVHW